MQITLQIKKITGAKVMPAWLDGCLFKSYSILKSVNSIFMQKFLISIVSFRDLRHHN